MNKLNKTLERVRRELFIEQAQVDSKNKLLDTYSQT